MVSNTSIPRRFAPSSLPQDIGLQELFRQKVSDLGATSAYVFLSDTLETAHDLSYEALGASAESIALKLKALTAPGDRVLLAFNNDLEAIQLFWGCILAGAIPIPAPAPDIKNGNGSQARLSAIASDACIGLALTHESHLEAGRRQISGLPWYCLQSLLAEPHEAGAPRFEPSAVDHLAIAYLQYTSGSTSTPRGVKVSQKNLLAQCQALMDGLGTEGKNALIWLPWFHDYGLVHGVVQPLYSGGTSYLMSTTHFLLRPLKWLEAIAKHRITHSGAPDFAYVACVQALARAPGWTAQLDCWALASCGAEPVRAATQDAFAAAFAPFGFKKTALAPSYGLAEAVLAVTVKNAPSAVSRCTVDNHAIEHHEVQIAPPGAPGTRALVSCGAALPGFELQIVDPQTRKPCAPNRVGEIWVSGPSVCEGYWGQPEATAETFGATLASEEARSPPYLRTGDLGFMQAGELFITGRRKDLIVVNGRNLYPQDLEQSAEQAHPSIRPGGTVAFSMDSGLKESVVMLVECSRRPSPESVRQIIDGIQKQVAADHQLDLQDVVPVRSGTLPRTSSGKPQRNAARRAYLQGAFEAHRLEALKPAQMVAPTESTSDAAMVAELSKLWAEVLGFDSIEPDANFFDLGGDSLLATQLVSRLRARLDLELPISAIFESPTIRRLARVVVQAQGAPTKPPAAKMEGATAPPTQRRSGDQVVLSFSQERMWFMHELAPQSSAYNVPLAIRLHGSLDLDALHTAFSQVVERHEILRTRFIKTNEGVVGEVCSAGPLHIEEVQLSTEEGAFSEISLHRHLASVTGVPFELDDGPLLRVQVVRLAQDNAVLLIVMHHIVSDQWSFAELGKELAAHYSASRKGKESSLPPLPIQYADYAKWHRAWFEGERRENELSYWSARLDGLEPLPLNNDFPRPRTQSFRGSALRIPLGADLIAALRKFGAAHDASLSMVLIAALNILLHRHTGKTDIAIGVPIANRHHLASEQLIGTFVNTLVFRTDLDGEPDFCTVMSRVRETSLEAFAHQDMPFELLVRELAARSEGNREPLFNVMFNMVNSQARDCEFEGLTWSRLDFDRASTQFDLAFIADFLYDQSVAIEYSTDLFSPETVQRMGEHFELILRAAVIDHATPVARLSLLSDTERANLTKWSLGTAVQHSAQSVVEWIAKGLLTSAQNAAVVFGATQLSHQELHEASNRLARVLRQRGIARGARVGVCLPRSHELVIALLAILKTGAAYVPLDPDYPSQRLIHQIDDADLAILVTLRSVELASEQPPRLMLDEEQALIAATSASPLEAAPLLDAKPEDPAYVIYTSGSTGRPKGVAVPHRAVVNFLASMARAPGLTAQDRLLAVTTPSFDIAALELFLPLGMGATVVVASEAQATDGRALAEAIVREKITVLQATPSRWHLLIDAGWTANAQLKALVGGEPLTPSLASQLLARCAEVWNMYGPTETTVWSSCWRVSAQAVQAIDLGRPVMNTSVQVLDKHLQPCPIGVPGEIYIGGTGVALGYYKRPELTAERFISQAAAPIAENARIYRTGDRGRWRHDGSLEHGGRLDDQIKLRGFRVELGEIETNLLTHPSVARAVVSVREDLPGQVRLVAYIVPQGQMASRDELRQHLRQWLPDHMVPSHLVELASIPVLPNGKTNRKALPAPPNNPSGKDATSVTPRNPTESAIWKSWQETLQLEKFSIHDNFFDLGGHSILAVNAMSRIEAALGRPCQLAMLFEHPTVADLAAAIEQATANGAEDSPVAVLQPHGKGPGLFLLAGADTYRHLAQRLDPEMPVFGVFSQTEIDILKIPADAAIPMVSVEMLAQEYIALIRSVQPNGPYYLGGFSFGGALAYEVALRLRQAGEDIGLIVLLDSMLPGHGIKYLWAGVSRRLRMLRRDGWKHIRHVYRVYRHQTSQRHEPGGRRIQVYAETMRAYRAVASDLPVLFLQAGDDASTAPAYGWRSFVPDLVIERTPGKHMDILEPPNVDVLASFVRTHIASATAKARGNLSKGSKDSGASTTYR